MRVSRYYHRTAAFARFPACRYACGLAVSLALILVPFGAAGALGGYSVAYNGVHVRSQPNTSSAIVATLNSGTPIDISCQVMGESVSSSGVGTSAVWDNVPAYGGWIADLFVSGTPYAQFDPRLPVCGSQTTTTSSPAAFTVSLDDVTIRSGPSTAFSPVGTVDAGTALTIQCQVIGQSVSWSGQGTSSVWDDVPALGGWIADLFVTGTPYGQLDSSLPVCTSVPSLPSGPPTTTATTQPPNPTTTSTTTTTTPTSTPSPTSTSPVGPTPTTAAPPDVLPTNGVLSAGQTLVSSNGQYVFAVQSDGNVVLYNAAGTALWASGTVGNVGAALAMQGDGNLVLYVGSRPIWASNTGGRPAGNYYFAIQTDGNGVIYGPSGPVWATQTDGGRNTLAVPNPASSTSTREQQAIAWAESQVGSDLWSGYCDRFVAAAFGRTASGYPSALAHWQALDSSGSTHRGDQSVPAGALAFFGPSSYNYDLGHVMLSVGNGRFVSTDVYTKSGSGAAFVVNYTTIAWMNQWSGPYLGWAWADSSWPGR